MIISRNLEIKRATFECRGAYSKDGDRVKFIATIGDKRKCDMIIDGVMAVKRSGDALTVVYRYKPDPEWFDRSRFESIINKQNTQL